MSFGIFWRKNKPKGLWVNSLHQDLSGGRLLAGTPRLEIGSWCLESHRYGAGGGWTVKSGGKHLSPHKYWPVPTQWGMQISIRIGEGRSICVTPREEECRPWWHLCKPQVVGSNFQQGCLSWQSVDWWTRTKEGGSQHGIEVCWQTEASPMGQGSVVADGGDKLWIQTDKLWSINSSNEYFAAGPNPWNLT